MEIYTSLISTFGHFNLNRRSFWWILRPSQFLPGSLADLIRFHLRILARVYFWAGSHSLTSATRFGALRPALQRPLVRIQLGQKNVVVRDERQKVLVDDVLVRQAYLGFLFPRNHLPPICQHKSTALLNGEKRWTRIVRALTDKH